MAEKHPPSAGLDSERALVDLADRIAYPPSPDLTGRVRDRIGARTVPPASIYRLLRPWPRAVAVLVAALLLAAGVAAVTPASREAVAEWLNLPGVRFFAAPEPPAATSVLSEPDSMASLADGDRLSLDEARRRVPFTVRVPDPSLVGSPDQVYVAGGSATRRVTLLYRPRAGLPEAGGTGVGLLLTQFQAEFAPFVNKGLPAGAALQSITVGGDRGFWIEGTPHVLILRDRSGAIGEHRSRLAGNTLLWERDGITYRLESALSRDQAIRIAESLR